MNELIDLMNSRSPYQLNINEKWILMQEVINLVIKIFICPVEFQWM
jgi:hypothetical protein